MRRKKDQVTPHSQYSRNDEKGAKCGLDAYGYRFLCSISFGKWASLDVLISPWARSTPNEIDQMHNAFCMCPDIAPLVADVEVAQLVLGIFDAAATEKLMLVEVLHHIPQLQDFVQ